MGVIFLLKLFVYILKSADCANQTKCTYDYFSTNKRASLQNYFLPAQLAIAAAAAATLAPNRKWNCSQLFKCTDCTLEQLVY